MSLTILQFYLIHIFLFLHVFLPILIVVFLLGENSFVQPRFTSIFIFVNNIEKFKMAIIDIKRPEDYKLYFHASREGNVWLDG